MENQHFYNLIFAALNGAALGLVRAHIWAGKEKSEKRSFGGVRTYTMAAMLGFLAMLFYQMGIQIMLVLIFGAMVILVVVGYYKDRKFLGLTGELTFLLTMVVGAMCAMNKLYAAAFITVIAVAVVGAKKPVHQWVEKITSNEIENATKFGMITLVILPLLPTKLSIATEVKEQFRYIPFDIVNPYEIWLVVVLVSGIGFIGYLLSKLWGSKKGILMTAISGGLVSSTAVTMNFSRQAAKSRYPYYLAAGILLASLIMFPRILIEGMIFHLPMARQLAIPFAAMVVAGAGYVFYLLRRAQNQKATDTELEVKNPLSLKDGIFFGLLYLGIQVLAWYGDKYMGDWGLYTVGLLSGLTDVDAITINMAKSSAKGMSLQVATVTTYLAAVSNTITKAVFAVVLAPRSFARLVVPGFVIILLPGLLVLFF